MSEARGCPTRPPLSKSAARVKLDPMPRLVCFALAALFAAVAASPWAAPAYADAALIARGYAIAKANCGRCHAVGKIGASANPKSPPFRTLSRKYPIVDLEEALGEGIMVGHEGLEMPQFRLDTAQIEALMAYLASMQRK